MNDTFSIKDALLAGWSNFKHHWALWVLVEFFIVISYLGYCHLVENGQFYLSSVIQYGGLTEYNFTAGLPNMANLSTVFFIKLIAGLILVVGLIRIGLDIQDHDKSGFFELFKHAHKIFVLFIAVLLSHLIISTGSMLLIFPGIYLWLNYSQVKFLIVEKKIGPIAALIKSAKLTHGVKWQLFGFYIVLGLINFVGLILFGFGLIITLPVSLGAMAYVYRKLHMRAFGVYAHEG